MFFSSLLILGGLILLAGGGEVLLRGAVGLSHRLKLTPAVIGLTVVAAGTSVPELAVSILASFRGSVDISVGNVVGSNLANGTLILGIAAMLTPLVVSGNMIRLEYPVMALVTLLCVAIFQDGTVNRVDGALLMACYVCFTAYLVGLVRERLERGEQLGFEAEVGELSGSPGAERSLGILLGIVGAGVALLGFGAHLTVLGAVEIGRLAGMSERIIGLTIVALGTSLPEIVTSVIAGMRGRGDVAIGNVIGSNIFNILVILGLSALAKPLVVAPAIIQTDGWWMLGAALILFPIMHTGMSVSRREGVLLIVVYVTYLGTLIVG